MGRARLAMRVALAGGERSDDDLVANSELRSYDPWTVNVDVNSCTDRPVDPWMHAWAMDLFDITR